MDKAALVESYTLARAQLDDEVIVATLRSEFPDADIKATEELSERWELERLSGLGRMQRTMYEAALGDGDYVKLESSQVTMLLWMMRQFGGHTPNGVDDATRKQEREMRKRLKDVDEETVEKVFGMLKLVER